MENGWIEYLDYAFARLLVRRFKEENAAVLAAASLASRVTSRGHVCLDLDNPEVQLADLGFEDLDLGGLLEGQRLMALLAKSPAVGFENQYKPLILSGTKLYLNRYFNYERSIADQVRDRCRQAAENIDSKLLAALLERYFGQDDRKEPVNWQKVAAVAAACKRLCIVSGGPGTGKTHTAARIIALLLSAFPGKVRRVLLAAPTGKAAARLQESILKARRDLDLDGPAADGFPVTASTIHRLLGLRGDGRAGRYNLSNPLPADLVIIDEASMIDLSLMHRLLESIVADTRLVLMGDKDQLASVEAGSVLADLCGRDGRISFSASFAKAVSKVCRFDLPGRMVVAEPSGGLVDHVVFLKRSYRFDPGGGIGALAAAINAGRAERVLELLADTRQTSLEWIRPDDGRQFREVVEKVVSENYLPLFRAEDTERRLQALEKFKILCAVQRGPYGVERLNSLAETVALAKGFIPARYLDTWPWYPGRPVMILQNDYRQQLFNGDTGVAVLDVRGGRIDFSVAFPAPGGQVRRIAAHRLPGLQTVFAATIHRSQGSEYDKVLIVLPNRDNPLLTRELLYTAVTRARSGVVVWAEESILAGAVRRQMHRASGLEAIVWSRRQKNMKGQEEHAYDHQG